MTEPTKRRWFRFHLSTVLILTAIAAWAMACRPYFVYETIHAGHWSLGDAERPGWVVAIGSYGHPNQTSATDTGYLLYFGPKPSLAYFIVALATFLAWKAAWIVGPRMVRRRGAEPTSVGSQSS
jgi:hypothetical protein